MPQPHLRAFALAALVVLLVSGCSHPPRGAADRPPGPVPTGSSTTGSSTTSSAAIGPNPIETATTAFAVLENRFHARLGVYVLDTGDGRTISYRADTRFAFASTGKVLTAAAVLQQHSAELDRVLSYRADDLQEHSPITSTHVSTGMTIRQLLAASLEDSDNTAANLLLARVGGPTGLQRQLRRMGDTTTRVDRTEPTLNETGPGDLRDTSTPRALGSDLKRFVLGPTLNQPERRLLETWLKGNTTGDSFIRAGVPAGWTVGDRTGSADYGTRNDIAIAWRPSGAPIVICVLSDRHQIDSASDDALIADATSLAVTALG